MRLAALPYVHTCILCGNIVTAYLFISAGCANCFKYVMHLFKAQLSLTVGLQEECNVKSLDYRDPRVAVNGGLLRDFTH